MRSFHILSKLVSFADKELERRYFMIKIVRYLSIFFCSLLLISILFVPVNAESYHTFTYTDFQPWFPQGVSHHPYGFIYQEIQGAPFEYSASSFLPSNCLITGLELKHRGARQVGEINLLIRFGERDDYGFEAWVVNKLLSWNLNSWWQYPVTEKIYLESKVHYDPKFDGQLIVRALGYNTLGPIGIDWVKVICGSESNVNNPPSPESAADIPPGHMPPPGECRIWYPNLPPGQQPPPGNCEQLRNQVPAGAKLIRG
jgi:hypothetical protein